MEVELNRNAKKTPNNSNRKTNQQKVNSLNNTNANQAESFGKPKSNIIQENNLKTIQSSAKHLEETVSSIHQKYVKEVEAIPEVVKNLEEASTASHPILKKWKEQQKKLELKKTAMDTKFKKGVATDVGKILGQVKRLREDIQVMEDKDKVASGSTSTRRVLRFLGRSMTRSAGLLQMEKKANLDLDQSQFQHGGNNLTYDPIADEYVEETPKTTRSRASQRRKPPKQDVEVLEERKRKRRTLETRLFQTTPVAMPASQAAFITMNDIKEEQEDSEQEVNRGVFGAAATVAGLMSPSCRGSFATPSNWTYQHLFNRASEPRSAASSSSMCLSLCDMSPLAPPDSSCPSGSDTDMDASSSSVMANNEVQETQQMYNNTLASASSSSSSTSSVEYLSSVEGQRSEAAKQAAQKRAEKRKFKINIKPKPGESYYNKSQSIDLNSSLMMDTDNNSTELPAAATELYGMLDDPGFTLSQDQTQIFGGSTPEAWTTPTQRRRSFIQDDLLDDGAEPFETFY